MSNQVDESKKELDELIYAVSHDLREPIRTVKSYSGLLTEELGEDLKGDSKEFLDFVVGGVNRMESLVDDLLKSSRVTTANFKLKEFNPKDVFENVLENFTDTIESKKAKITVADLPEVKADLKLFWNMMEYLIDNALKFTDGKQPVIDVKGEDNGKEVVISVQDNGIGIAENHFERIFVIFQRLHTASEYPGNGTGLALCKKIVKRHNGRIWLESKEGVGSTFFVAIPK